MGPDLDHRTKLENAIRRVHTALSTCSNDPIHCMSCPALFDRLAELQSELEQLEKESSL